VHHAGSIEAITGEHVNDLLDAGDPGVQRLVERFAEDVAVGLADLVYVLDPQVFVLGGGLVGLGEPLRRAVEENLAARILGAAHRQRVPVLTAVLGSFAGAIGAAALAWDQRE